MFLAIFYTSISPSIYYLLPLCLSVFVFLYCSLYNVHTTGKTPHQITQNALDAFAINSCIDAYVIHHALDGGEEAIFYLKHEPNWTDQLLILALQSFWVNMLGWRRIWCTWQWLTFITICITLLICTFILLIHPFIGMVLISASLF